MFLHINNLVEPVSRGNLVSDFDPDYPPICYACDDAETTGRYCVVVPQWKGHGSAGGGGARES